MKQVSVSTMYQKKVTMYKSLRKRKVTEHNKFELLVKGISTKKTVN